MNIDYLLFSGPKNKYNFVEVWGEIIFIPVFKNIDSDGFTLSESQINTKKQKKGNKNLLSKLKCCGCVTSQEKGEVVLEDDQIMEMEMQLATLEAESSEQTNRCSQLQEKIELTKFKMEEEKLSNNPNNIQYYIPCFYLNSLVKSKFIFLYFHSSGEDIKIARPFLTFIRDSYQVNVIAMQYRSYSIYRQFSASSEGIKTDANIVFDYVVNKLGFKQQNVIVMGRSIGTGVALNLLKGTTKNSHRRVKVRALVLISAFTSVKDLVRDAFGKIGSILSKETFNNFENISEIDCPVFALHGLDDKLIPWHQSKQLLKNCYKRKFLVTPTSMTHSSFDFYSDLIEPLRVFLSQEGVNFYEKNMKGPKIPDKLFELPRDFNY